MAGGKETPRQKMIGMMYLVLTALLALQVSSAIIQKFMFLDASLMNVNTKTIEENSALKSNIENIVRQEGNKDSAIVSQANLVRKETMEMVKYINDLRERLIQETGGLDDDGKGYKGGKEETKVEVIMVGGNKNGEGYTFRDKLKSYADFLRKQNVKVPDLAVDGKDDPTFSKDPEQRGKDFVQLNFAQTPMVAALAVLAQKQSEILKYENEALNVLAGKVGASDLKFDNVFGMVRAESKYVAAGTKYEADMFLSASSTAITPTMTAKGAAIKVDPNTKIGKVSFTAPGSVQYDSEGISKQSWSGEIKFKFKGKDTTFNVKGEYFVVKPVIQVQSASVQALYRNCGNELNIQVPALGSNYNPDFRATNASVYKNASKKGFVTIVPSATAREVAITVVNNGDVIGTENFQVRGIPRPSIEVMLGPNKPANEKQGEAAPGPRSLMMAAVPEENFKAFLPKDADYKVTSWECILVRGKRPMSTINVNGPTTALNQFASMAQPGDRILIEVKKVIRKNYKGDTEEVNVGTVIKNIPLY